MTSPHSDPHTQPHPHQRFSLRNIRNIRLRGGIVPLRAAFHKFCQSFHIPHRQNRPGSPPSAASQPSQAQPQSQSEPQPQSVPNSSTLTTLSQSSSLGSPHTQPNVLQQQQLSAKEQQQHPSLFSATTSTCTPFTTASPTSPSFPTAPPSDSLGDSGDFPFGFFQKKPEHDLPSDDPLIRYDSRLPPPRRAPYNGGNTCYLDCVLVALFAEYDGWDGLLQTASSSTSSTLPKSCLLYTSPSPRDLSTSRMPSSA